MNEQERDQPEHLAHEDRKWWPNVPPSADLCERLTYDATVLERMASDPDMLTAYYVGEPGGGGSVAEHCAAMGSRATAAAAELRRLEADNQRLREGITAALSQLVDHAKDDPLPWCRICQTADGSWPCTTRMVADDLQALLSDPVPTGGTTDD